MNLYETFSAKNLKIIWDTKQADKNRVPYVGELFFKPVRIRGLKLSFLKGKSGLPVALVPANWNTDVLYRDRIGLESIEAELPFFKEAYAIDEQTRQELMSVKDEYLIPIINRVFDDQTELLVGADVTPEIMRMQLLSQGVIAVEANGVKKDYNYGFDSSKQMKTLTKLWSAEGATPVKDFLAQVKAYKKLNKEVAKYAFMNSDVFDALASDASIKDYFAKLATPDYFPTDRAIKSYIESVSDVTIIINDKQYIKARDKSKTPVDFYPQDRFTLLSTLDLGETAYGTTPEEADLLNKTSAADSVAVTSKGVAITTWRKVDPVNVNTKVSEVVLPSCPNIDKIYIVKCL